MRAIGEIPSAELVRQVATAHPLSVTQTQFPGLSGKTPEAIAAQLCGTVQPGYVEAVIEANRAKAAIAAGQVLGPEAYDLTWPACLNLRGPISYKIASGDNFTSLRLRFTGEHANGPGLLAYFAQSGAPYADRMRLQVGTVVTLPYQTLPTVLRVDKSLAQSFTDKLLSIGKREVSVTQAPKSVGSIVIPFRGEYSAGAIQVTEGDCVSDPPQPADGSPPRPYPYSPEAVAKAWEWASKISLPNDVNILVVDNGFFGVPCTADRCPERDGEDYVYTARFPKRMFAKDDFYLDAPHLIGPALSGVP
uniref:Uncharacterized protein n=1 Tax=Phenylobacterium glaciei TaxID=2803784 RepID=A0A974P1W9_9CAUL|nr:hypothetical protein JKL49_16480 [Phenylobacterium glaciei]